MSRAHQSYYKNIKHVSNDINDTPQTTDPMKKFLMDIFRNKPKRNQQIV